jgi:hypothetical protein
LDGLIDCLHRYEEMLQDVEEKEEGSEVVASMPQPPNLLPLNLFSQIAYKRTNRNAND